MPRSGAYVLLKTVLSHALKLGLIGRNPLDAIDRPRVRSKELQVLDPGQIRKLLEAAQGHRLKPLIVLAVATGARQGELFGLQWRDLDLDAGVLTIQRTHVEVNGHIEFGEPKTKRSRRRVDIPHYAVEALREHRSHQPATPHPATLIFTDTSGQPAAGPRRELTERPLSDVPRRTQPELPIPGGLALWLQVSFLLAAMALGATVASLARHHRRPFHAIEGIEWPFMILFFLLAGASIDVGFLATLGTLIAAYVALRAGGIVVGATVGGRSAGAGPPIRRWLGMALLPQAEVALGMALVAAERFPVRVPEILSVAIAATAFFEIVGPVFTRLTVQRASSDSRDSRLVKE
jgi:hypothetical protein